MRHGGGEFAVAERRDDGERRADEPAENQQAGRFHLARDVGADDEDAGADHGAHDERGGGDEAEAFDEAGVCGGGFTYCFLSCSHSIVRSRLDYYLADPGSRPATMAAESAGKTGPNATQSMGWDGTARIRFFIMPGKVEENDTCRGKLWAQGFCGRMRLVNDPAALLISNAFQSTNRPACPERKLIANPLRGNLS